MESELITTSDNKKKDILYSLNDLSYKYFHNNATYTELENLIKYACQRMKIYVLIGGMSPNYSSVEVFFTAEPREQYMKILDLTNTADFDNILDILKYKEYHHRHNSVYIVGFNIWSYHNDGSRLKYARQYGYADLYSQHYPSLYQDDLKRSNNF